MGEHIWKVATPTKALWKCKKCGAVGFNPHPLPKDGCPVELAAASTSQVTNLESPKSKERK